MNTYTHGHHESVLRSHAWRTAENSAGYLLPYLRADMRLLDIGAGPGTISVDLAKRVAQVTAAEKGDQELRLSRDLADERGIANMTFEVLDIHALDIADDTYDVVHAHQVLQHVADPVQALREMGRVTRPGGLVAARDADYRACVWWPEIPELDEWMSLYQAAARANGGEPDAGRRLHAWARSAGFEDMTASSDTWCFATHTDREWWGGLWAERIVASDLAQQLIDEGRATRGDLERIADGWRAWAQCEDGWFSMLHGEIVCRVGESAGLTGQAKA
ncbi:MAG: class I SAM-dependent methyltransferase [Mycolicibacterium sp.]|uniref:class I SAM-dependent methyltransferase n=1 Tax=Mycolicibacterium sp. TaxID=2320850 RepID=UPI003D10CD1C